MKKNNTFLQFPYKSFSNIRQKHLNPPPPYESIQKKSSYKKLHFDQSEKLNFPLFPLALHALIFSFRRLLRAYKRPLPYGTGNEDDGTGDGMKINEAQDRLRVLWTLPWDRDVMAFWRHMRWPFSVRRDGHHLRKGMTWAGRGGWRMAKTSFEAKTEKCFWIFIWIFFSLKIEEFVLFFLKF